jgi:hypothetical protein
MLSWPVSQLNSWLRICTATFRFFSRKYGERHQSAQRSDTSGVCGVASPPAFQSADRAVPSQTKSYGTGSELGSNGMAGTAPAIGATRPPTSGTAGTGTGGAGAGGVTAPADSACGAASTTGAAASTNGGNSRRRNLNGRWRRWRCHGGGFLDGCSRNGRHWSCRRCERRLALRRKAFRTAGSNARCRLSPPGRRRLRWGRTAVCRRGRR